MQWRAGVVDRELARWSGAIEYAVRLDGAEGVDPEGVRALAYPAVVGEPRPGDRVLLNVSALLRGLGTGGLALIVAVPDRLPADPPASDGHIVKARYTPQQQMFLAVDEQDSPHHDTLRDGPAAAGDLRSMPVIVADLHSALPAVLAGLRMTHPDARVGYVMTDGGALPLAFSRAVAGLREAGWLATTITVGQAYGGEHEAVTLHSGLLAARHALGIDVAVVSQGPGNVGTGTPWGYSGIAVGEALNAVEVLGGHGVAVARVSAADARERHRGLSHHSATAYGRVALGAFDLPVVAGDDPFRQEVIVQARGLASGARGTCHVIEVAEDGLLEALRGSPVRLSTMGRGLDADPEAFLAAAAAGRHAASLL